MNTSILIHFTCQTCINEKLVRAADACDVTVLRGHTLLTIAQIAKLSDVVLIAIDADHPIMSDFDNLCELCESHGLGLLVLEDDSISVVISPPLKLTSHVQRHHR